MYQTLSHSEMAHRLAEEGNGFTYFGALALVEYLEDLEDQLGAQLPFDIVAIRCDYTEYPAATEAACDYYGCGESGLARELGVEWDDEYPQANETSGNLEELEAAARDHLEDEGWLVAVAGPNEFADFKGSIIVCPD